MLTKIYAQNPSERELRRVVAALADDGVVIYPTDSRYAFGCAVRSVKGIERLRRLKGKETQFALVFADLAQVAGFCRVDNAAVRILKRNLPGPFTFVLPASSRVPDKTLGKRKTVGVRIPAHPVARAIVGALGEPLVATSLPEDECAPEYATDPESIHERYGRDVQWVVDGGIGEPEPTTIVDLSGDEPEILREGKGELK